MKPFFLLAPLALGYYLAYEVFGYDLGLWYFLFLLLFVAIVWYYFHEQMTLKTNAVVRLCFSLLLAFSHLIYEQTYFIVLNILLGFFGSLYGLFLLRYPQQDMLLAAGVYIRKLFIIAFMRIANYVADVIDASIGLFTHKHIDKKTASGIAIGLLVLACIIPLLSAADPIFAQRTHDFFSHFTRIVDIFRYLDGRVVAMFVASLVFWSLCYFFKEATVQYTPSIQQVWKLDEQIYTIVLICVSVVYLLFVFIQVKYLFWGAVLPVWFTYSSYAVQGFWQLTALSVLNIVLLLFAPTKISKMVTVYNTMLWLLFLSSVIISYAGLFRLQLYIGQYGLTFMRVLPRSFIIYLSYGLCVAFFANTIVVADTKKLLIYGLMRWYLVLNLVGVDRIISHYNIERFLDGKNSIDSMYLQSLSMDQLRNKRTIFDVQQKLSDQLQQQGVICKSREEFYAVDNGPADCRSFLLIQNYKQSLTNTLYRQEAHRQSRSWIRHALRATPH